MAADSEVAGGSVAVAAIQSQKGKENEAERRRRRRRQKKKGGKREKEGGEVEVTIKAEEADRSSEEVSVSPSIRAHVRAPRKRAVKKLQTFTHRCFISLNFFNVAGTCGRRNRVRDRSSGH